MRKKILAFCILFIAAVNVKALSLGKAKPYLEKLNVISEKVRVCKQNYRVGVQMSVSVNKLTIEQIEDVAGYALERGRSLIALYGIYYSITQVILRKTKVENLIEDLSLVLEKEYVDLSKEFSEFFAASNNEVVATSSNISEIKQNIQKFELALKNVKRIALDNHKYVSFKNLDDIFDFLLVTSFNRLIIQNIALMSSCYPTNDIKHVDKFLEALIKEKHLSKEDKELRIGFIKNPFVLIADELSSFFPDVTVSKFEEEWEEYDIAFLKTTTSEMKELVKKLIGVTLRPLKISKIYYAINSITNSKNEENFRNHASLLNSSLGFHYNAVRCFCRLEESGQLDYSSIAWLQAFTVDTVSTLEKEGDMYMLGLSNFVSKLGKISSALNVRLYLIEKFEKLHREKLSMKIKFGFEEYILAAKIWAFVHYHFPHSDNSLVKQIQISMTFKETLSELEAAEEQIYQNYTTKHMEHLFNSYSIAPQFIPILFKSDNNDINKLIPLEWPEVESYSTISLEKYKAMCKEIFVENNVIVTNELNVCNMRDFYDCVYDSIIRYILFAYIRTANIKDDILIIIQELLEWSFSRFWRDVNENDLGFVKLILNNGLDTKYIPQIRAYILRNMPSIFSGSFKLALLMLECNSFLTEKADAKLLSKFQSQVDKFHKWWDLLPNNLLFSSIKGEFIWYIHSGGFIKLPENDRIDYSRNLLKDFFLNVQKELLHKKPGKDRIIKILCGLLEIPKKTMINDLDSWFISFSLAPSNNLELIEHQSIIVDNDIKKSTLKSIASVIYVFANECHSTYLNCNLYLPHIPQLISIFIAIYSDNNLVKEFVDYIQSINFEYTPLLKRSDLTLPSFSYYTCLVYIVNIVGKYYNLRFQRYTEYPFLNIKPVRTTLASLIKLKRNCIQIGSFMNFLKILENKDF